MFINDLDPNTPETIFREKELDALILDNVRHRVYNIMMMRNGIGCKQRTLKSIAMLENISKERVRQLEFLGYRKIAHICGGLL